MTGSTVRLVGSATVGIKVLVAGRAVVVVVAGAVVPVVTVVLGALFVAVPAPAAGVELEANGGLLPHADSKRRAKSKTGAIQSRRTWCTIVGADLADAASPQPRCSVHII
jgi:hypothetical protein